MNELCRRETPDVSSCAQAGDRCDRQLLYSLYSHVRYSTAPYAGGRRDRTSPHPARISLVPPRPPHGDVRRVRGPDSRVRRRHKVPRAPRGVAFGCAPNELGGVHYQLMPSDVCDGARSGCGKECMRGWWVRVRAAACARIGGQAWARSSLHHLQITRSPTRPTTTASTTFSWTGLPR